MNISKDVLRRAGKIIAVVTIEHPDDAVPLAEALLAGGVTSIELTLRTERALDAMREVKTSVPDMVLGAGTVIFSEQVDQVVGVGVDFAVSPGFNPEITEKALSCGLPFAPGVMTPSDIEGAISCGCRVLKFFPAESSGGLTHLKSVSAPYGYLGLQFIPLGGVSPVNLEEYLSQSNIPAVGGSWIAPVNMIKNRDWPAIERNAQEAVAMLRDAGLGEH